jgi:hypothetical protein
LAMLPGNANLPIGAAKTANREIGVPSVQPAPVLSFSSRHTRPYAQACILRVHGTMN